MESATDVERVDVLIVGAGISGIGAAHHLKERFPGRRFVVLDALEGFGGTWLTHRYPGVRSDSDLFTFGYRFKPWRGAPLAGAEEIRRYLGEVIDEDGLAAHIRYGHRVVSADWCGPGARWEVTARRGATGAAVHFEAAFLWMCQGYYRHAEGYTPAWPGLDEFAGTVVHPQSWPEGLDLRGARVVVVGSGATAATLIPAIADEAAHVTMLQRSPTFFFVRPNTNELAETLRSLDVPDEWTHEIVRRKILADSAAMNRQSFEDPLALRKALIGAIRPLLPEGFDVERHFSPSYRPWQQRVAVVPDGDLFAAIRTGSVSVVTDGILRFDAGGIRLASGGRLDADVVVTATGFELSVMGDIDFRVDGVPVDFARTVTYRGIMFTGVPNLAYVFGYFRSSWTLRADLVSDFVLRLLADMDRRGVATVTPGLRDDEVGMALGPWVDPENFNPGYLVRSMHLMPAQGDRDPWRLHHDYLVERDLLAGADLDDGALRFG